MNNIKYLTVTALNKYISYKFEVDEHLVKLYVKGEISNLRLSAGHLYFSLKDENSEISAVMFKSNVSKLKFEPTDGMTVLVEASLGVYQKKGTYNLTVVKMGEIGLGEAYLNFLRLKEKLAKEGLFEDKYKLEIPEYCENIGVITSATGDALHDIVSTISKRFPIATIYLYPALVQGSDAPRDLIRALYQAYSNDKLDCLIIGRGGGSMEDLSCFNDETLARVIFKSPIPIVSAVGHEADYTICDFVSSFRAPTPTGAAVRVSQDKYHIMSNLDNLERHLYNLILKKIDYEEFQYNSLISTYGFKHYLDSINRKIVEVNNLENQINMLSPLSIIKYNESKIDDLSRRLHLFGITDKIDEYEMNIDNYIQKLNMNILNFVKNTDLQLDKVIEKMILVNPLNILSKGYTLTYQEGNLITSVNDINITKPLEIKYHDGVVETKIINCEEYLKEK